MTPIETVQHIYAAFGRGDIPAILDCLSEDIEWEYGSFPNPVPWLQPRRGRAELPAFFQVLAEQLEFKSFTPKQMLADKQLVVCLVDLVAVSRRTGKQLIEQDEVHLWHFDGAGRVQRFRHQCDSWQHAMVLRED